jgi:hypothetical protein
MMSSNGDLSPPRREERPSTEIVHSLFGVAVGRCWGDFSCSHYRQRGRLYAASNAIGFFSNLFGFERRICLHLDDVSDIKAFRTTSIQVTTTEGEQYIFKSFQNRELVVLLLLQLKQGHSNGSTRQRTGSDDENGERLAPLETSVDMSMDSTSEQVDETAKRQQDSATGLETISLTVEEGDEPQSPANESESETVTTDAAVALIVPPVIPPDEPEAPMQNNLENSTEILPEVVSLEQWENAKNAKEPPFNEISVDVRSLFWCFRCMLLVSLHLTCLVSFFSQYP